MEIEIGQKATVSRVFDAALVRAYVELTGDHNPVHSDADFAATTVFKKPIVHGPLVMTLVTTMFANELPGPGSVYLAHDVKYVLPVYFDDEITAEVEVVDINANGHIFLKTTCKNQYGEMVLTGIARLKKY